jgi:ribbon-helix-helix protein, copG family
MVKPNGMFYTLIGGDFVPLTDSKRKANNKYIAEHMTVLGVKVRKDYADQVRQKAKERGDTVNAILKAALEKYMED